MSAAAETFSFQAEVAQLLDLVIHSLYSHKEVFLRELVSNASDALDKLRFRALTEPDLLKDGAALEVRIAADPAAGTLTIEDTGVGMSHDELVKNLGTIAHSGTKAFLEASRASQEAGKPLDLTLIGQFGVGFYSAYLVADRVEVTSRAAGSAEAWRWSSDAKSAFEVTPATREARGTSVVLHLKADQKVFLEDWKVKELVLRYSDFVSYPIKLQDEAINKASALWQRPRAEITDEQHAEFYKHLTRDADAPLSRAHFTIEGTQVFTALLYIPKKPPVLDFGEDRPKGVRLFVKRVFIMDDAKELLPPWMRFVRGVVDSDDLPLNVSRELLQDSSIVRTIKKQLTKRVLDLLDEMAAERPDDYAAFWRAWGVCIKEGVATEWEHKERLAKLLRFASTKTEGEGLVSLAEYVARIPLRQEGIYYVLGESRAALLASPYLEGLVGKGFEVLLLTDPVDEFTVDSLREFDKRPLVSAMRADLKLGDDDDAEKKKVREAELSPLTKWIHEVLTEQVADVRLSDRLTDSPCCLVVPEGGHHAFLEQVLKTHGRQVPTSKRVLEVNPAHPLVATLAKLHARGASDPRLREWVELLYDQALLTEGSKLPDPNRFAKRMTTLLEQAAKVAAEG